MINRTGYRRNRPSDTLDGMSLRLDSNQSDEDLMLRFARGDDAAFEALYGRHRGPLFRFVMRSVGIVAVAEELFQDIWMRLIDSKARYQPTARFQTYLYRIAQNRVIDHYRSSRPTESLSQDGMDERIEDRSQIGIERTLDAANAQHALKQAISELPLEQRTAFLLQTERGMSLEQIADVSGVGRETIKSRLRYAITKLREALGVNYEPSA